jgi:thiol-disulfide isomerase/thioredoxin
MRAAATLVLAALVAAPVPARAEADPPALAKLRRDVTVVAFWASWCKPCIDELPRLEALHRRFQDDPHVRIVAVSIDTRAHRAAASEHFGKLSLPLVLDGRALYRRYFHDDEMVVPRLAVVDRRDHGLSHVGFTPDAAEAEFIGEVVQAIAPVRSGSGAVPEGWRRLR